MIVAHHLTCCIQHCNSSTMNNTLRTDIHIRAGSHLSILAHAECIVTFPIIRFAVVRNYHTVGNNHSWCGLVRWEQSERMTTIHNKSLLIGHLRQIFHHQAILCPVLKYCTITSISNQLMRMLCHSLIKIVLNHHHDCSSLFRTMRIFVYRTSIHFVCRTEAIHIYTSVFFQFFSKL